MDSTPRGTHRFFAGYHDWPFSSNRLASMGCMGAINEALCAGGENIESLIWEQLPEPHLSGPGKCPLGGRELTGLTQFTRGPGYFPWLGGTQPSGNPQLNQDR